MRSLCRATAVSTCLVAFGLAGRAAAHEPVEPGSPDGGVLATTPPVLLQRVEPIYPEAARKAGIGGTVALEITVEADGHVSTVLVTRSAGFGLDEAAVAAARSFGFRPATKGGTPIASTVLFDQRFVIRPHLSAETSAETSAEPAPPTGPPGDGDLPSGPQTESRSAYESTVIARGPTTAASSTTIRNLDFDLRPKTSPNDVLRVVPGLLAVQHQGGGKADQLFLRGFDADHGTDVGVFIDGIPVNLPSHAHGQGFADLHWLIPEVLERIDVAKGPYDVRWGDFATAGAVNLITKKAFDASSVQLTLGGFPSVDGRLVASERFVGLVAPQLTGRAEKLHPWFAFEAAHDDGPFANPENLRRYNLLGKVSYDVSPSTTVGALLQAYGSAWIGSGQIPAREVAAGRLSSLGALDPSEGGLTERQMLALFVHHKTSDREIDATVYVTRYRLSLWNDFTFFLEDPVNGSEIEQDDARTITGARVAYHFHRRWHGLSFRTTMGVDSRYDGIHVDRFDAESCSVNGSGCTSGDFRKRLGRHVDTSSFALNANNDDIDQINIAGYAEEDVVFNRHLRIVGGLRADYFSFNVSDRSESYGAEVAPTSGVRQVALVSPKATAVITAIPDRLDFYLNYGSGFHSNQAPVALRDGTQQLDASGHPFIVRAVPKLYGGELGVRANLWNRVDLAGAFWMSYLQNETVFDADHASFVPSAATKRIGVDLEARARLLRWLYADFDLAQASATAVPDRGNGGAVALAPRLYMTGGLTAKTPRGLRAGLRFRYLGPRPAFDETSPEYQYFNAKTLASGRPNPDYNPDRVSTAGSLIFDAYAGWRWRFLEASVSVQNLLNSSWREAEFGNHSCTLDETNNPQNPYYNGSGNILSNGRYVNRCGVSHQMDVDPKTGQKIDTRSGVTDVHFTPGVPLNIQATLKAFF